VLPVVGRDAVVGEVFDAVVVPVFDAVVGPVFAAEPDVVGPFEAVLAPAVEPDLVGVEAALAGVAALAGGLLTAGFFS
jgi:hypothetical protein